MINEQLLVEKNFRDKIIGRRIFQLLLLVNNTLVIINNTNEKNCCYFPIGKRSGNIIYCNKTLKIVFFDVTFFFLHLFFFDKSRKPGVAGGARSRDNLVKFSIKQENQRRIITFVNNLYQNCQVSLNYLFSKHNRLYQQTISFIDCIMSTQLYVINSVNDYGPKIFWQYIFLVQTILKLILFVPLLTKQIPTNGWLQITSGNFLPL